MSDTIPSFWYRSVRYFIWIALILGGVCYPKGILADTKVQLRAEVQLRADHMVLESVTDGKLIFAATQNGRINCFDLKSGKKKKDLLNLKPVAGADYSPTIFSVSLSSGDKYIAAGSSIGKVFIFDSRSRQLLKAIAIPGIENILVVRFLDEERLMLGLMDGTVRLLLWKKGEEKYRSKIELDPVNNIRIAKDRQLMAVTTGASTIKIVSTANGKIIQELVGHKDTIYGLVFSGSKRLISGSKDMTLRRWNLVTGKGEVLYKSRFFVNSVAWNGKDLIAFHLPDYKIGIMNYQTGKIILQLEGHTAFINTLHFITPNRLMSSGNDARIFIHRI